MKNITITLDVRTAAWVRVLAARHGKSVSRLVGEILQRQMTESRDYSNAMRRFLTKKPVRLKRPDEPYPARDDLHDRARLR